MNDINKNINIKNSFNNKKKENIEEHINEIFDRINSKFGTTTTEDNLNYERENNVNNNLISNKIKSETFSLSDIKSSFSSSNDNKKTKNEENSINLESIINVEISNNINEKLKENEIVPSIKNKFKINENLKKNQSKKKILIMFHLLIKMI